MRINRLNEGIKKLDKQPLWILGIPFLVLLFVPYLIMGEGSVFAIHDQMDETICAYVLNARNMFSGLEVYPEMLGGINASGIMPSAVLFVPLYRWLPFFAAFVIQYFIVCATAFFGMYLLIRKLTASSGIAFIAGALFCMLPYKPVYGLSVVGVPLLAFCFWQLYERKHIAASLAAVAYFALTTHLVLIGYVVLTYFGIAALCLLWKKKGFKKEDLWFYAGIVLLTAIYCIVNYQMFLQLILGASDYISHRQEIVNNTEGIDVWRNIKNMFLYGEQQYAPDFHFYFLLPAALVTIVQGFRYRKLSEQGRKMWKILAALWMIAAVNALLYGFFTSPKVMEWRNGQSGLFRYFQADRYYWAYPAIWWAILGLSLGLVWKEFPKCMEVIKIVVLLAVMLPTLNRIKTESNIYDNINQYNHGSAYTGKLTWKEYYMQDVLAQVDAHIGRDKSTYRVASLGLNPAPSLVYGFYTIDGYSNNYPLEYKHAFRKIIEKELEKNKTLEVYFDTWGSRCYLFSAQGDNSLKSAGFAYTGLELNIGQMKALGCEYIFSAKEIQSSTEGLKLEGVFGTEESVYEIWLYRIV